MDKEEAIKALEETLNEIEFNMIFLNVNPDYIVELFKKKLELIE